ELFERKRRYLPLAERLAGNLRSEGRRMPTDRPDANEPNGTASDRTVPERPDLQGVAALKAARLGPNSYLTERAAQGVDRLTIPGVIVRTTILFGVLVVCAAIPWSMALRGEPVGVFFWGGLIGAFALSIAISVKPSFAATLGPVYAACEGLCLG